LLLHPEAVFRVELGEGPRESDGRVMLAPLELAQSIAFALTDRGPDAALLKAMRGGRLATSEDVLREINRILDEPRTEKPRILRFFQEYFGYTAATLVFKDKPLLSYPFELVDETDRLVLFVLEADKNVLAELLTTNKVFLHYENQKAYGTDYKRRDGKTGPRVSAYDFSVAPQPYALPPEERAGILTQPSWLVAHSTNVDNHAIRRGKWVHERLLGGVIPDTPITVDARLPEETETTLRERMRVTREPLCWKCHERMDPLGLAFEMYDHYGRYRTEEPVTAIVYDANLKKDRKQEVRKPVDATGAVIGTGVAELDGPVGNAVELMHKLARSERVEQVFVRHAFRYWMGRNETLADAGTLQAAHRAYRDSEGSMKALIRSLLTSDSFLYRLPPESSPAGR
jgi:hypothetical protein